jgi:hypothetical protein
MNKDYPSMLLYMNQEKEKEWDELDETVKSAVLLNVKEAVKKTEIGISIDILAHCINELNERICTLEKKNVRRSKRIKKSS